MEEKDKNIKLGEDVSGSSEQARKDLQGASGEDLERGTRKEENASKEEEVAGGGPTWLFIAPSEFSDNGYSPPDVPLILSLVKEQGSKQCGSYCELLRQKLGYRPFYFINPTNNPFASCFLRSKRLKSDCEVSLLFSVRGPEGSGISELSTRRIFEKEHSDDCKSDKCRHLKFSTNLENIFIWDWECPWRFPLSKGSSTLSSQSEILRTSSTFESSSGCVVDERRLDYRELYNFYSIILDQSKMLRKGSQSTFWHQAIRKKTSSKRSSKNYETGRFIPVKGPFRLEISGSSTAAGEELSTADGVKSPNVDESVFKNVLYIQLPKTTNPTDAYKSLDSKEYILLKAGIRLEDVRLFDTDDVCKSRSPSKSPCKSRSRSESPQTVPRLDALPGYATDDNSFTSSTGRECSGSKGFKRKKTSHQRSRSLRHQDVGIVTSFRNLPELHYEIGNFIPVDGPFLIAAQETSSKVVGPSKVIKMSAEEERGEVEGKKDSSTNSDQ